MVFSWISDNHLINFCSESQLTCTLTLLILDIFIPLLQLLNFLLVLDKSIKNPDNATNNPIADSDEVDAEEEEEEAQNTSPNQIGESATHQQFEEVPLYPPPQIRTDNDDNPDGEDLLLSVSVVE